MHYYGHSSYRRNDSSLVISIPFYPLGNLQTFAQQLIHRLDRRDNHFHESFAFDSFCRLVHQISLPLQMFNMGKVSMQSIYVRSKKYQKWTFDFDLQFMPSSNMDRMMSISKLAEAAWKYYAIICAESALLSLNGSVVSKRLNPLCHKSKLFWPSTQKKNDFNVAYQLITLYTDYGESWKASKEFAMLNFISTHRGLAHFTRPNNWTEFSFGLRRLCRGSYSRN